MHAGGCTFGVFIWSAALAAQMTGANQKGSGDCRSLFSIGYAQLKLHVGYWMVRLTLADPAGVVLSGNVVLPVTVKARAPLADAEVFASPR
jgi:hypothetical protein